MTPTVELRFVERETGKTYMDEFGYYQKQTIRVLQQKWAHTGVGGITGYVWRDVPLVKEEA